MLSSRWKLNNFNMNKTNKQIFQSLTNKSLKGLIEHCHKNPEARAEVLRRMNKRLAKPITRVSLFSWLHHQPSKRSQPIGGALLMLQSVWEGLQAERGDNVQGDQ